jgi:uncharacterized membrane protein YtjA (UPF0391 family)
MEEDEVLHRSGTQTRAGTTPGVARVVLVVGLVLVIVAFAIILLVGGT